MVGKITLSSLLDEFTDESTDELNLRKVALLKG
jgi:hypothetical protein